MPTPGRFRDLSIRYKLFFSYFLLVLFFLCLFLVINTALATRENEAQAVRSARRVFEQTRAYLQFKTESVGNLLYYLSTNPAVQDLFERRSAYYFKDMGRWPLDSQALDKIFYPTSLNPDIAAVCFYMKYGLASAFRNDTHIPLQDVAADHWYRRVLDNTQRAHWFRDDGPPPPGGRSFVHAVRCVFGSRDVDEVTGVIRFDIPERLLRVTLTNTLLTESAAAFIVQADGLVVCSAGSLAAERDRELLANAVSRSGVHFSSESWETVSFYGERYLVGSRSVGNSEWVLALVLPYRDIVRLSAKPVRQMSVVLLLIVPLSLLFALFVSRSATKRIESLIGNMEKVVGGDFTVRLNPKNRDEIGRLTESFNIMISEIGQLIEEKYRLGKEVKHLELKALQAQINPHFLYNTLDLINWMSVRYGARDISTLVGALSKFYKLSLSKGEDTVTVREEIEHARTYVQIQNMRYEDSIGLVVEVPDAVLECDILKLIVQPLVENAIFHGIMLKPEERGIIHIRGELAGPDLLLLVEDDGVGMQEPVASRLPGALPSREYHGYGVRNIHERIQLNYGTEYGLSFRSEPGKGTTAMIKVPAARRTAGAQTGGEGHASEAPFEGRP